MLLTEFKSKFVNELKGEFPKEEVQSFFNILTDSFLKMSRLDVALAPEKKLTETQLEEFEVALLRLKNHEPIQYITGETEFFGLKFKVNKSVLIPRPETEDLVLWILDDFKERKEELKILDIGTGSGCIAISLAKNLAQAKITAIDISEDAIETARQNAELNQVEIEFKQTDILQMTELPEYYDVIVSNPPYVRELEKEDMQRNVLEFEPETALYVKDHDPLLFYEKISELAVNSLKSNGTVYFETNQYLGKETKRILTGKNFHTILKKDIFEVDRMLKGTKA